MPARCVEDCAAGELAEAKHPYTRGLLAAMPRSADRRAELPCLQRDPPGWPTHERARRRQHRLRHRLHAPCVAVTRRHASPSPKARASALVGESGSGKSTVLRAIAGLVPNGPARSRCSARAAGARRRTTASRKMPDGVPGPLRLAASAPDGRPTLAEPLAIHRLRPRRGAIAAGAGRGRPRRRASASATRTSSPAASASAWRSPAP